MIGPPPTRLLIAIVALALGAVAVVVAAVLLEQVLV